jgi:PAS domain S-box-containing protein
MPDMLRSDQTDILSNQKLSMRLVIHHKFLFLAVLAASVMLVVMTLASSLTASMMAEGAQSTLIGVHKAYPGLLLLEMLLLLLLAGVAYVLTSETDKEQQLLDQFRILDDFAGFAIAVDQSGIVLYLNRAATSLLGQRSSGFMLGIHIDEIASLNRKEALHDATSPGFFGHICKRTPWYGECVLSFHGKQVVQADLHACGMFDTGGTLSGYLLTFSDNRARKSAERQKIKEQQLQTRTLELSRSFLSAKGISHSYQVMLDLFMLATDSEFGFVGEVMKDDDSTEEYVHVGAITNIAWNQATRDLYRPSGMIFRGLNTLWGRVITTKQPVISNSPATDPRRKGLPDGHPPLHCFLGIPFMSGDRIVGMIGLANNPDGYDEGMVRYLEPTISVCAHLIAGEQMRIASQRLSDNYRNLLNEAPIMYLYVGSRKDGFPILECNAKFIEMVGGSHDDIVGNGVMEYLYDSPNKSLIGNSIDGTDNTAPHDRCQWRGKDGRLVTTQFTVVSEMDEDGNFLHAKIMLVDLSNYLSALATADNTAKEFFHIIEAVHTPILVTNQYGLITHWNTQMEELTGAVADSALGTDVRLVNMGLLQRDKFNDHISKALQGHEFQGLSFELIDAAGKNQHLFLSITPRFSHEGQQNGVVMIGQVMTRYLNDMSERYYLQKMETIGQLTGGIAHDFNNLLTVILGNVEYLEQIVDTTADADLKLALEDARSAARDGASLVSTLLSFARRKTVRNNVFELKSAINAVLGLATRTLGEKIKLVVDNEAEVSLNIDRAMLESSILNILINARDAMDSEGSIRVETHLCKFSDDDAESNPHDIAPGQWAVISVADEGVGMDAKTQKLAIEPFFTTKPEGKGTGLGLSMTYGFIAQCGGRLKIDSQPGKGSVITIYLPLQDESASHNEVLAIDNANAGSRRLAGRRILLVEDDSRVRNNAYRILKNEGCAVTSCENAELALEQLEKSTFDALFSDIVMPGKLDGRTLATLVGKLYPELPVLLTTGYDKVGENKLQGEFALLAKPYSGEQLIGRLQALVDRDY